MLTSYEGETPAGVRSVGHVSRDELARLYRTAAGLVFPSLFEGFGQPPLEAMASGCPVVAARAGGIPDLIDPGENGHLYAPDDPADAIDAIRALLARPSLRRFTAQQARKRAEGSSWQRETRRLVLEYRKAIVIASQRGLLGRIAERVLG